MKNTMFLVLSLFALSCGDNLKPGSTNNDGNPGDGGNLPAAPTLGSQIDRMGRPAVNTALNGTFFDAALDAKAKKDAYNQADTASDWTTTEVAAGRTIVQEFATNLAVLDILDKDHPSIPNPDGCGNGALYQGPPSATSYAQLATVLTDDQLFVDSTKSSCGFYLSLEVEVATAGAIVHSFCGGRTPSHDVIDVSYSLLAAGLGGFVPGTFAPRIGDDVVAHTDIDETTFPFLGAPHP